MPQVDNVETIQWRMNLKTWQYRKKVEKQPLFPGINWLCALVLLVCLGGPCDRRKTIPLSQSPFLWEIRAGNEGMRRQACDFANQRTCC